MKRLLKILMSATIFITLLSISVVFAANNKYKYGTGLKPMTSERRELLRKNGHLHIMTADKTTNNLEGGNAPYKITGAESNSSSLTLEIEAKENAPKAKIIAAFYSDSGELVKTFTKDITSSGVYDFEKPCRNYKIFIWDMQKLVPYAMPLECLYGLYEN